MVCPRLSLSPAVEKIFSETPITFPSLNRALKVSMPFLYKVKWTYLCLPLGSIFLRFLLYLSLMLPFTVVLSTRCS